MTVKIIGEGSEEQGTGGLEAFVPQHPELLAADAILVCDAGNVAVGAPSLTTSLRGLANVWVTVRALSSEMHSGMFGGPAPDALAALVAMLATLRDERGNTTIDGLAAAADVERGAATRPSSSARTRNVLDGVDLLGDDVGDMVWARPTATVLGIDCPPVVGSSAAIQPRGAGADQPAGAAGHERQARTGRADRRISPRSPLGMCKVEFEPGGRRRAVRRRAVRAGYETMTSAMRDAYGVDPVVAGAGRLDPAVQRLRRDLPRRRDHAARRRGAALPDPCAQRERRPDGDRQHGAGRSPVPATVCGGGGLVTATPATRTGGVLAATCLSTLVVNANTSAVSILLPAISEDTGMSVTTLQWAVTGYSLVGAAVIVTSGSLGDVFGRRRIFQLGLMLFVASCVLIALSTTGGMVIAGRMIQGAAGSTILACGLSLLSVANNGEAQLRAVSLWGAAAAVGAAAGPLVGGLLVGLTGWQGLFWIDAVVAVVCIAHHRRDGDRVARPQPVRGRSTTPAPSWSPSPSRPLILALSKGSDWGWTSLATIGCLVGPSSPASAFVAVERRVEVPLLDLALLRNRVLVGSTMAILIGAGTINALMYLLSLYFQDPVALGFSPLQAGLATLPATVGLVIVAPLVPRLAKKFGGRQVVGAGFAITAVGLRRDRAQPERLAVRRLRASTDRRRGRDGAVERPGVLGGHRLRVVQPGRRGVRRLEHGEVRRRRGGDGARRVDLQLA